MYLINEEENQCLIEFARELSKIVKHKDDAAAELLRLIYINIESYEKKAYPLPECEPTEILAFLMEQHGLTQSDLPEIGSQPHVSKILHGERQLTREQIGILAKRFNVSPAVFFK